ncbi:Sensor protein BasS [compost metagenome]
MKGQNSIRGRMVAVFVLLAAIIGGVFAGSAFFVIEEIEDQLIDDRLAPAAERWAAASDSAAQPPVSNLRFFVDQQIPQSLERLALGIHELRVNGRTLHVLIQEVGGQRYAVVDDESDLEAIESQAYIALGLAFLGGIVLALLMGWASSSKVILPLTDLASAVQDELRTETLPGLDATDEIGILARAIEDRTNQLGHALQRERWFTADVSHELRSPLAVLLGAAEVLERRLKSHPDLLTLTDRIRHNAADIAQQMNALLQLARVPESLHLTCVNLRPLIERELQRCQPLLLGRPLAIELVSTEDVRVQAIPDLVAIAVSHLLRDACLHTEQGVITVHLDTGGIVVESNNARALDTVDNRSFERRKPVYDDSSGPGLSLSIVKRVADHLGWVVRHTSATVGSSRYLLEFGPEPGRAIPTLWVG